MAHRSETLMAAVLSTLTGLTTTGTLVERTRVRTVETAPALTIEMGADDVNEEQSAYPNIARELNVKIIAHVKKNSAMDTQLNLIRQEVYVALMADTTQGQTFVTDTFLISDDEPEFTGDADQIVGRQQINFVIQYRHSWTDPGA